MLPCSDFDGSKMSRTFSEGGRRNTVFAFSSGSRMVMEKRTQTPYLETANSRVRVKIFLLLLRGYPSSPGFLFLRTSSVPAHRLPSWSRACKFSTKIPKLHFPSVNRQSDSNVKTFTCVKQSRNRADIGKNNFHV
jgi:hypothetical protein